MDRWVGRRLFVPQRPQHNSNSTKFLQSQCQQQLVNLDFNRSTIAIYICIEEAKFASCIENKGDDVKLITYVSVDGKR